MGLVPVVISVSYIHDTAGCWAWSVRSLKGCGSASGCPCIRHMYRAVSPRVAGISGPKQAWVVSTAMLLSIIHWTGLV